MNLKKIIKTNQNNVKSIIRLITKEDNEDLEQEVYIKVWKNSEKYKEQGSFKSWISTIAKNVSKDYLKSVQKRNQDALTTDDNILNTIKDQKSTPELKVISNDRQKIITTAIEGLRPKFKEVIMLCEIYDYTYEEASFKLKMSGRHNKIKVVQRKKRISNKITRFIIKERMLHVKEIINYGKHINVCVSICMFC